MATQKVLVVAASGTNTELTPNTSSAGASDAGKLIALAANGFLDPTVLPPGAAPDAITMTFSEAVAAGALVNVYNNGGTQNARNADGSTTGKEATGFATSAVANGTVGTVTFAGIISGLSGLTPGPVFLSDTAAGGVSNTVVTTAGHTLQRVGTAITTTQVQFQPGQPTTRA